MKSFKNLLVSFGLIVLLAPLGLNQTRFSIESGDRQISLIELYTSEGCSSCPPGDQWLSALKNHPDLWKKFVPVSFHVDYWDYIGWKDPFGAKKFSIRQRFYANEWQSQSVYTPGFVLNGTEWKAWGDSIPENSQPIGNLKVTQLSESDFLAEFKPMDSISLKEAEIHMAILEMDLESHVKAGENRGKTLRHDFVVRAMSRADLKKDAMGLKTILKKPVFAPGAHQQLAFVFWVTPKGKQTPMQCVGAFVP
jgi:hypothetical protein